MNSTRRLIPKRGSAPVAFADPSRGACLGAPSWLGAAFAGVCLAGAPSRAAADPGTVELRTGNRIAGDLVAIAPNDRVVVVLADGTTLSIPWSDVRFVFDGTRVFDGAGHVAPLPYRPSVVAEAAAPRATDTPDVPDAPRVALPPPTAGVAPRPYPPSGDARYPAQPVFDPTLHAQYLELPGRGGSITLGVFGGMFLAQGIGTMGLGFAFGCYGSDYGSGCSIRNTFVGAGAVSAGFGALMLGAAIRRHHRRRVGTLELERRGMLVSEAHHGFEVTLDLDAAPGRLVPHLRLRF